MKTITINTRYLKNENAYLVPGRYGNGQLALRLIAADGEFAGETLSTATVNLEAYGIAPEEGHLLIKDVNENEGMLKSLIQNGIVRPSVKKHDYGFVKQGAAEAPLTEIGLTIFQEAHTQD